MNSIDKINIELYVDNSSEKFKKATNALYGNALMNDFAFLDESFKSPILLTEDDFWSSLGNGLPLKLYVTRHDINVSIVLDTKEYILTIDVIPEKPYRGKLNDKSNRCVDLAPYIKTALLLCENFFIKEIYVEAC